MVDTLERMKKANTTQTREPAVAKKPKTPTTTIRVAADVARMLTQVATNLDIDVSDLVDPVLRPFATQQFREMAKRVKQEADKLS